MNVATAIIASAVGVAWIVWYLGWRLRTRSGLRPTDRIRRGSNAVMGWAAFEGCVLTGTLWPPALSLVMVLLALWLLLRLAIVIVDRTQERAAQRRSFRSTAMRIAGTAQTATSLACAWPAASTWTSRATNDRDRPVLGIISDAVPMIPRTLGR